MKFFSQFRPLLIIYGICVIPAIIEYLRGEDGIAVRDNIYSNPDNVRRLSHVFSELYPEQASTFYFHGYYALHARDYKTALVNFERAVELDPTHEGALHGYAEALVCMQAQPHLIAQAVERWQNHFPHSDRADPRDRVVRDSEMYLLGIKAVQETRLADARRYFEQDLRAGVRTEHLLYNYALVLAAMGAPDDQVRSAIDAWKRAYPFSSMPDPRAALSQQ